MQQFTELLSRVSNPVRLLGQSLAVITGDDYEDSVRKVENIIVNLADNMSYGTMTSILDEFFPEADSRSKAILREAYNKAMEKINSGSEELNKMHNLEGTTMVGSATDRHVAARKGKLQQDLNEAYSRAEEISSKLQTPMSTAERIRDIGA
jgi:vacuolar-type H+-ATPase subunit H